MWGPYARTADDRTRQGIGTESHGRLHDRIVGRYFCDRAVASASRLCRHGRSRAIGQRYRDGRARRERPVPLSRCTRFRCCPARYGRFAAGEMKMFAARVQLLTHYFAAFLFVAMTGPSAYCAEDLASQLQPLVDGFAGEAA